MKSKCNLSQTKCKCIGEKISHFDEKDDITNVSLRLFSRQHAIKTDLKDMKQIILAQDKISVVSQVCESNSEEKIYRVVSKHHDTKT